MNSLVEGAIQVCLVSFFLGCPILVLFAFRDFFKSINQTLPKWRTRCGLVSVSLALANWLILVFLMLSARAWPEVGVFLNAWALASPFMVAISMISGFALRGTARTNAILAGIFMAAIWIVGLTTGRSVLPAEIPRSSVRV